MRIARNIVGEQLEGLKSLANRRRKLSPAEEIALITQVNRICPLCGAPNFYTKENGRAQKGYEIAHIYPLNPTEEETELLKIEEKLVSDPNHVANLIPLCLKCHGQFDKPRTREEYRELLSLKKTFIRREQLQSLQSRYPLESEIQKIMSALYDEHLETSNPDLSYDPKTLDQKLNGSITQPTKRIIRHHVSDYFPYIRRKLLEVESNNPNAAELISSQVRTFYLFQKTPAVSQEEVFKNVVSWMVSKTDPSTADAAEIVAAFFVQNCEVFE